MPNLVETIPSDWALQGTQRGHGASFGHGRLVNLKFVSDLIKN